MIGRELEKGSARRLRGPCQDPYSHDPRRARATRGTRGRVNPKRPVRPPWGRPASRLQSPTTSNLKGTSDLKGGPKDHIAKGKIISHACPVGWPNCPRRLGFELRRTAVWCRYPLNLRPELRVDETSGGRSQGGAIRDEAERRRGGRGVEARRIFGPFPAGPPPFGRHQKDAVWSAGRWFRMDQILGKRCVVGPRNDHSQRPDGGGDSTWPGSWAFDGRARCQAAEKRAAALGAATMGEGWLVSILGWEKAQAAKKRSHRRRRDSGREFSRAWGRNSNRLAGARLFEAEPGRTSMPYRRRHRWLGIGWAPGVWRRLGRVYRGAPPRCLWRRDPPASCAAGGYSYAEVSKRARPLGGWARSDLGFRGGSELLGETGALRPRAAWQTLQ